MRQVPRIFVSYAWWLNCRPLMSQLIFSLQGLVSVSGPPSQRNNFNLPKKPNRFMPRHHHTSKAFVPTGCDCILHWELLLGGVSTPGGWFLGPLSGIQIDILSWWSYFLRFFTFLFSPPKGQWQQNLYNVASNGQRVGSLLGKMPYSKVFIFTPIFLEDYLLDEPIFQLDGYLNN